MMKPGADVAQLSPSATGWRMRSGGQVREVATLAEAAVALPPRAPLHLALPCQYVLLERLTLPSRDPEELTGMAQLQLEKTLPYPVEEVAFDLEVLRESGDESHVVSLSAHIPGLTALCEPLQAIGHLPSRITLFAQAVVPRTVGAESALCVWPEQGSLVIAFAESGKLGWAQTIPGIDENSLASELPAMLLGAEMNGLNVQFEQVLLAAECGDLSDALTGLTGRQPELFTTESVVDEGAIDFLPADWSAEADRQVRFERLKLRFLIGTFIYLLLMALTFLYLAWTKRQGQGLDFQIAQLQPQIQTTQIRRQKWEALAPAFDWHRFTVETLALVNQNRPSDDVRITLFDCSPGQFTVEGEAPSAELAIDFAEKLRAEKGLEAFRIETGPPQILPNEHAQFRLFGKP